MSIQDNKTAKKVSAVLNEELDASYGKMVRK